MYPQQSPAGTSTCECIRVSWLSLLATEPPSLPFSGEGDLPRPQPSLHMDMCVCLAFAHGKESLRNSLGGTT